ncbi:torsin-like protein [Microplitis demolitor]|uniref:torsin-like protein n=1 Tax=Microplitis demolitor TaxID=69319 RepID=UPI0004CCC4B9|nr:torsin-like protein [Microplitis demolitor]
MNTHTVLAIILTVFTLKVECLVDPFTGALIATGAGLYFGYNKVKCSYYECCNDHYIHYDLTRLDDALEKNLYGQHIAHDVVVSALRAHVKSGHSPKALAMSFHGTPGTGKNFVTQNIVNNFYKEGAKSKYFHFFSGRLSFPLQNMVAMYQDELKDSIINSLVECPQSLFVFDEVDMMSPGILNVLVPFMEYSTAQIFHRGNRVNVETNKAIFIFLSNTGSQEIVETLHHLWQSGKKREETSLSDFEELISKGAFNEKGGFHKSDTITTSLIDHYVPFLPLESEHVEKCIEAAFRKRGRNPSAQQIQDVMSHVTFSPPLEIFAKSGCKRIEQKVASNIYRRSSK